MSAADFHSLAPFLTLTIGLVVLLLVIAFARNHLVAALVTITALVAALVALLITGDAPPRTVLDLLRVDGYAGFFNGLFLIAAIATCILAYRYLSGRKGELEEFYILVVIATLGAMVMASAHHFATFILGLEILAVSLYAMIAYPEEKHPPLEAALKYLVLSAVASTTLLFGMALIYNASGTMYFGDIPDVVDPKLQIYLRVGQALLFTGIAFKLSLVPFHMWTPDVYQGAPAPVTGYIATVSKAAVFAMLLRLAIDSDALSSPVVTISLSVFAVLSMLVGNVLALMQTNIKRLLAYSSIAHMGYLMMALLGVVHLPDAQFAVEAALVYLAGYTLMTLAAFGVISMLSSAVEGDDAQDIAHYNGLFWRQPVAATCLAVAMLALMGMPLTIGFIGKFYLVAAGIQGAMWLLLWALIIGSAISVYYYVKVIYAMSLTQGNLAYQHPRKSMADLPTVVALGVATIALGVYPAPLIEAVKTLLGNFGL